MAMSHENATLVGSQFQSIFDGTGMQAKIWDAERVV